MLLREIVTGVVFRITKHRMFINNTLIINLILSFFLKKKKKKYRNVYLDLKKKMKNVL